MQTSRLMNHSRCCGRMRRSPLPNAPIQAFMPGGVRPGSMMFSSTVEHSWPQWRRVAGSTPASLMISWVVFPDTIAMPGRGCVKVQVRDVERNLRSYFRVAIIRVASKPRTDAARWCAGRSNKNWLIPIVFPKSKVHRSERTSCQSSLSNVCPLLFCVFVCVCACLRGQLLYRLPVVSRVPACSPD
jgi:hypothetical protein